MKFVRDVENEIPAHLKYYLLAFEEELKMINALRRKQ